MTTTKKHKKNYNNNKKKKKKKELHIKRNTGRNKGTSLQISNECREEFILKPEVQLDDYSFNFYVHVSLDYSSSFLRMSFLFG